MNITNSTIIIQNNEETLIETLGYIIGFAVIICIYRCFCTSSKKENDKIFRWGVERAQANIAFRNELNSF